MEKGSVKYTLIPLRIVPHSKDTKSERCSFLSMVQPRKNMKESRKTHKEIKEPRCTLDKSVLECQSCESQEGTSLEGVELKGPDVEIKSINREPVTIVVEGKDNK